MWYCANGYPRDVVSKPCEQSVAQDEMRKDLWRCNLVRNCNLMNNHSPAVCLFCQSNTDAQAVVTKHQAEMYLCKYCAKHHKNPGARSTLFDVLDDMDSKDKSVRSKFGTTATETTLGSKLHKTFMAEIGEEMCQAEVAHHANKCPEYLCSRPVKYVHLYKKGLAFKTQAQKADDADDGWDEDDWGEDEWREWREMRNGWAATDDKKKTSHKRATTRSDIDLYESRGTYAFPANTPPSPHLPYRGSPELQVAEMSVYTFFRYVHFHGGKQPYLTWHEEDAMPIVIVTPGTKLREGPGFAYAARWALIQHHVWADRAEFIAPNDEVVVEHFRAWLETPACPEYVKDDYADANQRKRRIRRATGTANTERLPGDGGDDVDEQEQENHDAATQTEESIDEDASAARDPDNDTSILKMLYRGNLQERNRAEAQLRKSSLCNHKHSFYRNTRCTSIAQEEQSALPVGVTNVFEDSDDDEAYTGEQKEIEKELQELRRVQHLVNLDTFDAQAESHATSPTTGRVIDLRLNWEHVKTTLSKDTGSEDNEQSTTRLDAATVRREYDLDALDPTQRAFADRVLKWAEDLARVYEHNIHTGDRKPPPKLRTWLCGSAGSGKSRTLKALVQHIRLLYQERNICATVELTAYTGIAAFNIGFGAKTSCTSFQISPGQSWKKELTGEAARRLERTWRNVVLLIVDEISFIGTSFFARMHFRMQQGRREYFSEAAKNPHNATFGDVSMILVGDFGQLEPIDDLSMVDTETTWATIAKPLRSIWGHIRQGRLLLQQFTEAVVLRRIHRSKHDLWWTESCLRLRDFSCEKQTDYDVWLQHDLDRGHLSKDQKKYFEDEAVWLCARCEDVGQRNGRKLATMAEEGKRVVHQIKAEHQGSKHAKKQPSKAFEGLREVVNLVRGCKVMLSRNVAYLHGLANGTRGKLVGIVYGPGGIGTLPEAIVVEIPDYCGPAFYPDEPKWVPILPMTSVKEGNP